MITIEYVVAIYHKENMILLWLILKIDFAIYLIIESRLTLSIRYYIPLSTLDNFTVLVDYARLQ